VSPLVRIMRDRIRPADLDRVLNLLTNRELIIAPADTVYGAFGKAFDAEVANRLNRLKGDRREPYAALFANFEQLEGTIGELDLRRRRIAKTLLPGPVTLILPHFNRLPAEFRQGSECIGVRVSSDALIPEICSRLNAPLWGSSANRSGGVDPVDFLSIDKRVLEEAALALDAGPTLFHQASTIVDLSAMPFKIKRPGPWQARIEQTLKKALMPVKILVLCSGNICRSPLAAALLQNLIGDAHKTGIEIASAGLDAVPGETASFMMVQIGYEWGIDLTAHRARMAASEIYKSVDLILAAAVTHRERIIKIDPKAVDKVRLLGEKIGVDSIPDPYERGEEAYRASAELIRQAVEAWAEWLKPARL